MNRVQGLEQFADINEGNFVLYKIQRIGEKKDKLVMQKDESNEEKE